MSNGYGPPDGGRQPRVRDLDLFTAVQALIVVVLGVIAVCLIFQGDPKDAALVGTGLVGAINLNRKSTQP